MPLKKAISMVAPIPAAAETVPVAVVAPTKAEPYTGGRKAFSDTMSKADWAAKDVRISRQGLFQAALQSPALMQYSPTLEAYLELVVRTANAGLAYVNE